MPVFLGITKAVTICIPDVFPKRSVWNQQFQVTIPRELQVKTKICLMSNLETCRLVQSTLLRLMSEIMQYIYLNKFYMTLALMVFRWANVGFDQFWMLCFFYLGLWALLLRNTTSFDWSRKQIIFMVVFLTLWALIRSPCTGFWCNRIIILGFIKSLNNSSMLTFIFVFPNFFSGPVFSNSKN